MATFVRKQVEKCVIVFAGILIVGHGVRAADTGVKETASQMLDNHAEAIVSVKLVIKTGMVVNGRQMNEREQTNEVTGTVIASSGLTAVSEFASNPMAAMQEMMAGMAGGAAGSFEMTSDINDVKMVTAEGKELPAEVVLRDKDLDLIFVRPAEPPQESMGHIDLTEAGKPQLLSDVIILRRLGRSVNRVPSVELSYVSALVKHPRPFYIIDQLSGVQSLGCPVFDHEGQVIGISVMRKAAGQSNSSMMLMGGGAGGTPVVIPAKNLHNIAQQAPEPKDEQTESE